MIDEYRIPRRPDFDAVRRVRIVGARACVGAPQGGEEMLETRRLPEEPDAVAPDGSEIRLLSTGLRGGSMVHARLRPGGVTRPVRHRTVEEMWVCIAGSGRMWRRSAGGDEEVTDLAPGVGVGIPPGTRFQFRCDGAHVLEVVIATMPPWPGDEEAVLCEGPWASSV